MILVVDHYDSFVYNLVQLVGSMGFETEVVRSDAEPVQELVERRPAAVILSPGPGHPSEAGCMAELIEALDPETPLLGVCLGHQVLGFAMGATIRRAEPVHGKATGIHHAGRGLFAGVPNPFAGGRYHSLVVEYADLPADLEVTAWSDDGTIMAIEHRELPRFGVQFHPESILTPEGPRIVENFLARIP